MRFFGNFFFTLCPKKSWFRFCHGERSWQEIMNLRFRNKISKKPARKFSVSFPQKVTEFLKILSNFLKKLSNFFPP